MKGYMLLFIFLNSLFLLLGGLIGFNIYPLLIDKEYIYFNMTRSGIESKTTTGFYNTEDYFCVITKGRDLSSISGTVSHELCHYYIDKDYQHFCNNNITKKYIRR